MVYCADTNGQPIPDAIVGTAPVPAGVTARVDVPFNEARAPGDKLVVLLHHDAGAAGTFEYPNGPDASVATTNAAPVVTVQAAAQLPDTGAATVQWLL